VAVVLVAQSKILRNRDHKEVDLFCTRALMSKIALLSFNSFAKRGEALLQKRQLFHNGDQREVELFCTRALISQIALFSLCSFAERRCNRAMIYCNTFGGARCSYHQWDAETFVRVYVLILCACIFKNPPRIKLKNFHTSKSKRRCCSRMCVRCVSVLCVCVFLEIHVGVAHLSQCCKHVLCTISRISSRISVDW